MEEKLNIYQKLSKIRKPVEVIKKNRRGYGYTYVDEGEILSRITGSMRKYGVSLIPNITHGTAQVEPYHYVKTKTTKDGNTFEEHVNEVIVRADMDWIWVNDEDPNDRIVVPWLLVGSQADASQGFGSALTYASRYFLLKYFNVATSDDDPDEYRRKQKEAEEEENRLITEKLTDEIHKMVTEYLSSHPDEKANVANITKKYVRENGKASTNYFAIESSDVAAKLLMALKDKFASAQDGA